MQREDADESKNVADGDYRRSHLARLGSAQRRCSASPEWCHLAGGLSWRRLTWVWGRMCLHNILAYNMPGYRLHRFTDGASLCAESWCAELGFGSSDTASRHTQFHWVQYMSSRQHWQSEVHVAILVSRNTLSYPSSFSAVSKHCG